MPEKYRNIRTEDDDKKLTIFGENEIAGPILDPFVRQGFQRQHQQRRYIFQTWKHDSMIINMNTII